MFKKAQNIETAFRHIKTFSIVLVAACVFLTAFALYKSYALVAREGAKIYILANGKALEAFAADRKDNIPVEGRDHVKTFHQYFFTLHPDNKVIVANIDKALYLADATARKQYGSLRENGYYTDIITGNISQEIAVDSVVLSTAQYPYYFRCYGSLKIIRPNSITTRNLLTEGYLRNVARSDNNPHGFLIEKWATLDNRTIKTEPR